MDTLRDITYRGFTLNDASIRDGIIAGGGVGRGISGSVVDSWDMSDVDVSQFLEKRSEDEGMDAGDVHLGARRIRMAGTLYGRSRSELFDMYWDLRAALSPIMAQRDEPLDKGYQPLYFSVPTNRHEDYPEDQIAMRVLAMPRASQVVWQRDQQGGTSDTNALAIPWQATMICRDPAIQSAELVDHDFTLTTVVTGATAAFATDLVTKTSHGLVAGDRIYFTVLTGGTGLALNTAYYVLASGLTANDFKVSLTSGGTAVNITVANYTVVSYVKITTQSGNFVQRGTFVSKLNILLVVGALAGSVVVSAGDSNFTITVPASTGNRTIRFKSDKVLTLEENDVEVTRMDLITFQNSTTWPLIDPGTTPWTFTPTGLTLVAGSHMWFYESYA